MGHDGLSASHPEVAVLGTAEVLTRASDGAEYNPRCQKTEARVMTILRRYRKLMFQDVAQTARAGKGHMGE